MKYKKRSDINKTQKDDKMYPAEINTTLLKGQDQIHE